MRTSAIARFSLLSLLVLATIMLAASPASAEEGAAQAAGDDEGAAQEDSSGSDAATEEDTAASDELLDIVVPEETGTVRAALPSGVGIAVWNASVQGGGLTVIPSPLEISAGPGESPGTQSVTVDFARGRRHILALNLTLSSDFVGFVFLTDTASEVRAFPVKGSLTGSLSINAVAGSFTLVVHEGRGTVTGIALADEDADGEASVHPDRASAEQFPEQIAGLLHDRNLQRESFAAELKAASLRRDTARKAVEDGEAALELAQKNLSDMESLLTSEEEKLFQAETDIPVLQKDIAAKEKLLVSLESDFEKKKASREAAVASAEKVLLAAENAVTAAKKTLTAAETAFDKAKSALTAAKKRFAQLAPTASGATLSPAAKKAKIALDKAQATYDKSLLSLKAARNTVKKAEKNKTKAEATLDGARKVLTDAASRIEDIKTELDDMRAELHVVEKEVDSLRIAIPQMREGIEEARAALDDMAEEIRVALLEESAAKSEVAVLESATVFIQLQYDIGAALDAIAKIVLERAAELPVILAAVQSLHDDVVELQSDLQQQTLTGSLAEHLSFLETQSADAEGAALTYDALATRIEKAEWLSPARAPLKDTETKLAEAELLHRDNVIGWTKEAEEQAVEAAGKYADEVATGSGSGPADLLALAKLSLESIRTNLREAASVRLQSDAPPLPELQAVLLSIDDIRAAREKRESEEPWNAPLDLAVWPAREDLPKGARGIAVHPGNGNVYTAVLDPRGEKILLTSQSPDNVLIMDALTADPSTVVRMSGHKAPVMGSAWSPDSSMVATGSHDGTARLWNALDGTLLDTIQLKHLGGGVAFTPDGGQLVISDYENPTLLYDIETRTVVQELPEGIYPLVTPDGSTLLLAHNAELRIVNLATGAKTAIALKEPVTSLALSADGTQAYVGMIKGISAVVDIFGGAVLSEFSKDSATVLSVASGPSGRMITADETGTIRVYDDPKQSSPEATTEYAIPGSASNLSVSPTGSGFLVMFSRAGTGNGRLVHFNLPEWPGARAHRVAVRRKKLTAAETRAEIQAFGELWQKAKVAMQETEATEWEDIHTDMKRLLALYDLEERQKAVLEGIDNAPVDSASWPIAKGIFPGDLGSFSYAGEGAVSFTLLSPDGSIFALGSQLPDVLLYDASTGKPLPVSLKGNTKAVRHGVWSPDSTKFATLGFDATARVFDIVTGKELTVIQLPSAGDSITWNKDGTLAIAVTENPIRIYSSTDGSVVGTIPCRYCAALAVSPDGRFIIYADENKPSLYDRTTTTVRQAEEQWKSIAVSRWSADGTKAYFGLSEKAGTTIVDVASWTVVSNVRVNLTGVNTLAVDRYGRLVQGHDDGSIYLMEPSGDALSVVHEWDIEIPVKSITVSPSGKVFAVPSSRDASHIMLFGIPKSASVIEPVFNESGEKTTPARIAIDALAGKYPESGNFRQFAESIGEGPMVRERLRSDEKGLKLLARSAAVELNAEKASGTLELLKNAYLDAAEFRAKAALPATLASIEGMFGALGAGHSRTAAFSNTVLREAVRVSADLTRSHAASSAAAAAFVPAEDTVEIAAAVQTGNDARTPAMAMELMNLGGAVTVTSLQGDTDTVSIAADAGALRSTAKATVVDFTTSESEVTGVTMSLEAETGAILRAHVLRGSESVSVVDMGTGRTLEVDDGQGITGLLIEHPIAFMSQEAQDWIHYRDNYVSDYMYEWQDPGPAYHYFDVKHPELDKGAILAEAAKGRRGIPVAVKALDIRGNIAAPSSVENVLTPMKNGTYSRFWAPQMRSAVVHRDDPYELIHYSPGRYTGITLTRYRGSPKVDAVGTVFDGTFTPLPPEMVEWVDNTVVVSPLPPGLWLAAQTSGGASSIPKGSPPVGWTYDFDLAFTHGNSRDSVLPPEKGIDISTDICSVNTSGEGWFEGVNYSFTCKPAVAVGSVKARIYVKNIGRTSGTFALTVYSGYESTQGSGTPVYTGTVSLGAGQSKGLWVQVPVRADAEGRGMVRVVMKDSLGQVVSEGGRGVSPAGTVTAEEKRAHEEEAMKNQAIAMEKSMADTKAYFDFIGVANPPSVYDWKSVIAKVITPAQAEPLPVEITERLIRNAVIAKAKALLTGDPVRIAAAEGQLASAVGVYGGSLSFAGAPEAVKAPEGLIAQAEEEEKKAEAAQAVTEGKSQAINNIQASGVDLSAQQKQTENAKTVAWWFGKSDVPVSGISMKEKYETRTHQFGFLADRNGEKPEEGITFSGENAETHILFSIKEKKMVNFWIDSAEMGAIRVGGGLLPRYYDVSMTLKKLKKSGELEKVITSSSKKNPDGAESISEALEVGSYLLQIHDQTDYTKGNVGHPSGSPENIEIPLHIQAEPYRSQKITGRMSAEGRDVTMPVTMSVAKFVGSTRLEDYSEVPELNNQNTVWVISHGRANTEDSSQIAELTRSLSKLVVQPVTVDWELGAEDNIPELTGLQGSAWIEAVGDWTSNQLKKIGFAAHQVRAIGHSWGSYVSAEIGFNYGGKLGSLVALDPAADTPILGGRKYWGFKSPAFSFSKAAENSYAFHSSRFGNKKYALTAENAFAISAKEDYENESESEILEHLYLGNPFTNEAIDEVTDAIREHGFAVSLFASLLERNSFSSGDEVAQIFSPYNLQSSENELFVKDGYEGAFFVYPEQFKNDIGTEAGQYTWKARQFGFRAKDARGNDIIIPRNL